MHPPNLVHNSVYYMYTATKALEVPRLKAAGHNSKVKNGTTCSNPSAAPVVEHRNETTSHPSHNTRSCFIDHDVAVSRRKALAIKSGNTDWGVRLQYIYILII